VTTNPPPPVVGGVTTPTPTRTKHRKTKTGRNRSHVAAKKWTTGSKNWSLPPVVYSRGPFTLAIDLYRFRFWGIRGDESNVVLLTEVESAMWDDASAVMTGSLTYMTPDWAKRLHLKEGHKIRCEWSDDYGAHYHPLWTMRLDAPSADLMLHERTANLVSDLNRLSQSDDDFVFAKGKRRPRGWRADKAIRFILNKYGFELASCPVMKTHITNWHLTDVHPLDVIHSILLRERNMIGNSYGISMDWRERVHIRPVKRPSSLLVIGPQLLAATYSAVHNPRFATAVTARADAGAFSTADAKSHRKVTYSKLAATKQSHAGVKLYGYIHRNVYCASSDTEALTRDGWRSHEQLRPGVEILTLNHETGESEWQPLSSVNRFEVEDEEMVQIERPSHSSLTTLEHRWPTLRRGDVRHWVTARDLTTQDKIITAAPCADVPSEPIFSDALVEAVAWFWTEGSFSGRSRKQTRITQSLRANRGNVERIRAALVEQYGPAQEVRSVSRVGIPRAQLNPAGWTESKVRPSGCVNFFLNTAASVDLLAIAPEKIVSLDFIRALTLEQLELFIEVSLLADRTALQKIAQKNRGALAAIELASILAGRAPHAYQVESGMWYMNCRRHSRRLWIRERPSRSRYSGTVWCPTTKNGSWLARRNGTVYYTGNSPDANSIATLDHEGALFLAAVAKFQRQLAVTLPGIPSISRLDAFRIKLPQEGLNHIVYVADAKHTVDQRGYTVDATMVFQDPFRKDKSQIILNKLTDSAGSRSRPLPGPKSTGTKSGKTTKNKKVRSTAPTPVVGGVGTHPGANTGARSTVQ